MKKITARLAQDIVNYCRANALTLDGMAAELESGSPVDASRLVDYCDSHALQLFGLVDRARDLANGAPVHRAPYITADNLALIARQLDAPAFAALLAYWCAMANRYAWARELSFVMQREHDDRQRLQQPGQFEFRIQATQSGMTHSVFCTAPNCEIALNQVRLAYRAHTFTVLSQPVAIRAPHYFYSEIDAAECTDLIPLEAFQ